MMACVEDREVYIYYIFGALGMKNCSIRHTHLQLYNEVGMVVQCTLGKGICVEVPICCMKAI